MREIGIVYPKAERHLLAITSVQLSLKESFPSARLSYLDMDDLRAAGRIGVCDLLVLPPSHGETTPYEFLRDKTIASNIENYATQGAIAAFCSGAYAITDRFDYRYQDGRAVQYRGYIPLIDLFARGPADFDAVVREEETRFSDVRLLQVFTDAAGPHRATPLCYANGPAYAIAKPRSDMRVLAYLENGDAAIVAQQRGERGMVVGFGALPEIQAAHMPKNYKPWITEMRAAMTEAEPLRKAVWDEAMAILTRRRLYPRLADDNNLAPSNGLR